MPQLQAGRVLINTLNHDPLTPFELLVGSRISGLPRMVQLKFRAGLAVASAAQSWLLQSMCS